MLQLDTHAMLDVFFNQHKPLQYRARTIISHPNDTQSSVFYIKNGYLRVFRISEQGEELTLTMLKPKDFFPLTYGMTNTSALNSYYLETITPLEIWKVRIDQFVSFVKSEPAIYQELTQRVLLRFDNMLTKMEYLVFNNAYTKVAATVISCARKFGEVKGDTIIIPVPLTHKDIATLIGITRETTSLEMKKLEKQGYIARNGKQLVVKSLDKLEETIYIQTGTRNHFYNSI
jgi:CRP-like cAMP-binding protein